MLVNHGLDINDAIEYFGAILLCAMDDANPNLLAFKQHYILANAADSASIEICELQIAWRADVKDSSALQIASHKGRADLAKLLLQNGSNGRGEYWR